MIVGSKLNGFIIILLALFVVKVGHATDNGVYVQLNAGAAFAKPYRTSDSFFSMSNGYDYTTFEKYINETGYLAGAALGYRFSEQFRLEFEGLFQSNNLDKRDIRMTGSWSMPVMVRGTFFHSDNLAGDMERTAFLLNGYFDLKNNTSFTPYISGGLGVYHLRINDRRFTSIFDIGNGLSGSNDLDFAWQAGAGVFYTFNDTFSIDLKYRYLSGANAEVKMDRHSPYGVSFIRKETYEVGDHQLIAGVRIGF